jgi:hypothetical protein
MNIIRDFWRSLNRENLRTAFGMLFVKLRERYGATAKIRKTKIKEDVAAAVEAAKKGVAALRGRP